MEDSTSSGSESDHVPEKRKKIGSGSTGSTPQSITGDLESFHDGIVNAIIAYTANTQPQEEPVFPTTNDHNLYTDDSDDILSTDDSVEISTPPLSEDPCENLTGCEIHTPPLNEEPCENHTEREIHTPVFPESTPSDSSGSEATASPVIENAVVLERTTFLSLIARLNSWDKFCGEVDGIYSEDHDLSQVVEDLIELVMKYIRERPMSEFLLWKGSSLLKASLVLKDNIDDSGRIKLKAMISGLVRTFWDSLELNQHVVWERQLHLLNAFCFDLSLVSDVLNDVIHSLCELKAVVSEPLWALDEHGLCLLEKCGLFVDFARSLAVKFREMSKKQPACRERLGPWIDELKEVASLGDRHYAPLSANIQELLNDLLFEDLRHAVTNESIVELGEIYEEF